MKKILIITLAILVMSTAAFAQQRGPAPGAPQGAPQQGKGGPGPNGNDGPHGEAALAEYLGLTDQQKTAIQAIREGAREGMQALHEEKRANMEQLRAALEAENACGAGTLMLANRALDDKIRAAREAVEAQIVALLTEEQKAKYEAFQAAKAFLQQRHGQGQGQGPGPRG